MRSSSGSAALILNLCLFAIACSPGKDPIPTDIDGSVPIDSSTPADVDGSSPVDSSTPADVDGSMPIDSSTPADVDGSMPIDSSTPADVDDSTPAEVVPLIADETNVRTFQALFVRREDGTPLSGKSYSATLGTAKLSLVVVDGKLVLTVPPGVEGDVKLRVQLGKNTGLLQLNVEPAPQLADPVATMTTVFSDFRASLEAEGELIDDLVIAGKLSPTAQDAHSARLSSLASREAEFMALAPSDQQIAAQCIQETLAQVESNLEAGNELVAELGTLSYDDQQESIRLLRKFSKHVLLFTSPAVVGGLAGGLAGSLLGVAFAKTFFEDEWMGQYKKATETWEQLANLQLRPIDLIMTEFKADVSFTSGEPVPVSLDVTWRNAQAIDANNSTSWLEAALATLDIVNPVVVRLFENAEGFKFAPEHSTDEDPHALSAVQIVDISDSSVTCTLSGTVAAPSMTCSTATEGLTNFTFRVRYQADEVTLTTPSMSGAVELSVDACVDATAPVIDGVQVTCSAADEIAIHVTFTASAPGALVGSGYGACDPAETCYPTRLYFLSTGASDWAIAANGYNASLLSGTVNQGVIQITFLGKQCDGMTGSEALMAYYNHQWKVELMNSCNQRSNAVSF